MYQILMHPGVLGGRNSGKKLLPIQKLMKIIMEGLVFGIL
jgi:hypothetical protein